MILNLVRGMVLAVMVLVLSGCSTPNAGVEDAWLVTWESPAATRVGTVERTAFLVAYHKSPMHEQWLDDLRRRRDEASAAGDDALAAELEAEGEAAQDLAHRQLAGTAPLTDLLTRIEPLLREVAAEADVHMIVETGYALGMHMQAIDVTDRVVAKLGEANGGG